MTEAQVEMWFERMVDRLDKKFMDGQMNSSEYESRYSQLKSECEYLLKEEKWFERIYSA